MCPTCNLDLHTYMCCPSFTKVVHTVQSNCTIYYLPLPCGMGRPCAGRAPVCMPSLVVNWCNSVRLFQQGADPVSEPSSRTTAQAMWVCTAAAYSWPRQAYRHAGRPAEGVKEGGRCPSRPHEAQGGLRKPAWRGPAHQPASPYLLADWCEGRLCWSQSPSPSGPGCGRTPHVHPYNPSFDIK